MTESMSEPMKEQPMKEQPMEFTYDLRLGCYTTSCAPELYSIATREFIQFLGIASGSAYELETQLILLFELNFKTEKEISALLNELSEIQKMIYSFKTKLKNG